MNAATRTLALATNALICGTLAGLVALYAHGRSLPPSDGAYGISMWDVLKAPFVFAAQLRDARKENMIYGVDLAKVVASPGVYVFGRRWGQQFEALYVGKATSIRGRVKSHLNNLRLMQHLHNAKTGRRVVFAGRLVPKQGQQVQKCIALTERALIRYFLSEGHDLVNKQGTRLRRHELASSGNHP